ncbi:MAG: hypothetical protein AAGL11_08410 [Pseudomonadota bacterium]
MTRYLILSSLAFCALGANAGEAVTFATVDANADGFVSESEFVGWKTADGETSPAEALVKFIEIDADASGMISESEMNAAMAAKPEQTEMPDEM